MSLTQGEVWRIIDELKPTRTSYPSHPVLVTAVCDRLRFRKTTQLEYVLRKQLQSYKNKKNKSSVDRLSSSSELVYTADGDDDISDMEDDQQRNVRPVRKRKSFTELGPKARKLRTEVLYEKITDLVDEEKEISIERNEEVKSATQILAYLIYRINYNADKKLARLMHQVYDGEDIMEHEGFSSEEAVALMHDLTLTKQDMRTLKSYIESKGVTFPNTNKVLEERKRIRPANIRMEQNGFGVSVNYTELIFMTSKSLINVVEEKLGDGLNTNQDINVVYKDGGDTAGSQTVWKSKSMLEASDHMFQYSIAPLRVEQGNSILWKNPSPNAATSCRPVYLIRGTEDDETVLQPIIHNTDTARTDIQDTKIEIVTNGKSYYVTHTIHDTMKDLKLKKKLSGMGGADCILCKSRQSDWKNPAKIKEGFPITRNAEDTRKLYEQLIEIGDGEIIRAKGDYPEREGITLEPKTTSDQHSICITHSYINVLCWMLKVLYRCNCAFECWVEKSTILGEPIRRSKGVVQNVLKTEGLIVDQVAGANAKTGTSNDGNTGRRFFSQKHQQLVVSCVEEKYKNTIAELHEKVSVLLRVVSCYEKVDYMKVDNLGKEISMIIANKLPWVDINWTLHGLLHHSAELIHLNGGWSLGALSEEALEANNKFVRRYLEQYSRTSSPYLQLTDTMCRLLERSDPELLHRQDSIKKKLCCSECGRKHKTQNHKKYENQMCSTVLDKYDSLVHNCFE